MSSAWWLGWSCMLGLGTMGQTSENLCRFFGRGGEVHPSRLADSAFMKAVTGVAPARA